MNDVQLLKTIKQYRETAGIAALAVWACSRRGKRRVSRMMRWPTTDLAEGRDPKKSFRDPLEPPKPRLPNLGSRSDPRRERPRKMVDKACARRTARLRKHNWCNEALHGFARRPRGDRVSTGLGLAATWTKT